MTKHKYSTIALIILLIAILTGSVLSYLETDDIDLLCNTNGATLQRINGQWTCNTVHYAEAYYHHESDALVLDLTIVNTYTQLTGWNTSNIRGITLNNETFTLAKNTTYMIDSTFSFTGGANGIYHCAIFLNGIEQEDCEFQRTMGGGTTIGVSTISCLKTGLVDATLDLRCKDTNNPVSDMNFYAMNINVVEIQ